MNRKNPIRNKLAAALLALLMAVGMLPMPALAVTANSMSLEVGHVTALITDTEVKVPISATVNTGYGAGIITVEWDKSKLELTDVLFSDAVPADNGSAPVSNSGSYKIAFGDDFTSAPYTGIGTLFTLIFRIPSGAAAGTIPVKIRSADIQNTDIENMRVTTADGSVTLSPPVSGVALNKTSLSLSLGGSETLQATVSPANASGWTMTWKSGNAAIAAVDNTGKVTAVSAGKAIVVASAGGKSALCTVTVLPPTSLTGGTVTAPEGALLIVAERGKLGELRSTRIVPAPASGWNAASPGSIAEEADFSLPDTYKLLLVDGSTYRPLCAAWEKTA